MKKCMLYKLGVFSALTFFSHVEATPEGLEQILFSKEESANLVSVAPTPQVTQSTTPASDPSISAKMISKAFSRVAKKAIPSVVFISVESVAPESEGGAEGDPYGLFSDEFFRRFFEGPGSPQPRNPQPQIGQGSGFFISEDGYIMTNYHVVANAKQITIITQDGQNTEYAATLVGGDPQTDLAIIKIVNPDGKKFSYLALGDSDDIEICEFVIAIGNPLQLESSVTVGVISAKGRQNLRITELEDFIQTDAAINPGNSGGPLLDLDGNVIGINTAIVSRSGGYMGIGFAIPSNIAKSVSRQIIDKGAVSRGFLGVSLQPIDKDLAEALGLDKPEGALVADVVPDSAADKAGILQGDIILEINNIPMKSAASIRTDVMLQEPGSVVNLKINRKGKILYVKVTLGTYNKSSLTASENSQLLGIAVENLTPELIKKYRLVGDDGGVVIVDVKPGSIGAKIGLKRGFVILSLNHKKVTNVETFTEALSSIEKGKKVLILVKAGDVAKFFSVKIN